NRVLLLVNGIGLRTAERYLEEIGRCADLESIIRDVISRHAEGGQAPGLDRLRRMLSEGQAALCAGERCHVVIDYYEPILREKFDLDWQLRKNDLDALEQISGRYESLRDLLVDLAI